MNLELQIQEILNLNCYDQSALMRRYDLIKEICDSMIELDSPYQNDHEDASQFEMVGIIQIV